MTNLMKKRKNDKIFKNFCITLLLLKERKIKKQIKFLFI